VGISNNGVIEGNTFLHNQSFFQMKSVQGGGLSIEGLQSLAPATPALAGISTGTGNVKILNNIFQGNAAGAGDGGAISLNGVNGNEVTRNFHYQVEIYNNTINNNVAGVAGGGIALQDAIDVKIINNTIAHNDSTATGSKAFNGVAAFQLLPAGTPGTNIPATISQITPGLSLSASTAQPGAGVASRVHTPALSAALTQARVTTGGFSNPTLQNNIVWQNRTFYWAIDYSVDPVNCQLSGTTGSRPCFGLIPNLDTSSPVYSDFGVIGGASTLRLSPQRSVLTSVAGLPVTAGNIAGDPLFYASYFNRARNAVVDSLILTPESQTQNLQTAAAFDEGGNFIDLRFGPLTPNNPVTYAPYSNPLLQPGTPAKIGAHSAAPELQRDAAGRLRPTAITSPWTAGAFEVQ
jgi:large repetitive protein